MKSHSDADAAVLRRSIGKQTAACFIALILQAKRRLCGGCAAAVCGGLQNVNDINVRRSCAGAAAVLPHTPYRRFTPPIGSARRLSEGKTVTANRAKPHRQREASVAPVRSSNGATGRCRQTRCNRTNFPLRPSRRRSPGSAAHGMASRVAMSEIVARATGRARL